VSDSTTDPSLFARLRQNPKDEAAWKDFVTRYGRLIYAWARARGLADIDCEDIRQDVLTRLLGRLQGFQYDQRQSFRGYICVVTQHAVNDLLEERRRRPQATGDDVVVDLLASVEARADLGRQFEEEYDRELFEEACRRVEREVGKPAWDRFWLTVPVGLGGRGLAPPEAAQAAGVPVVRIYKIRNTIMGKLKEEIRRLGGHEQSW
jgi:RNA polymerase sigma factor (sigma-70 family)